MWRQPPGMEHAVMNVRSRLWGAAAAVTRCTRAGNTPSHQQPELDGVVFLSLLFSKYFYSVLKLRKKG